MCGIAGFIGESKNPEITFRLITGIFAKLENRGKDAAGFWGTQKGDEKILFHKEPIHSSNMVEKQVWKDVEGLNPNLLLVHAREASHGVGVPQINKNNHPFVSADLSVGLVHNGRIPDHIYDILKKKYEVLSGCDSEILLRIFEGGSTYPTADIDVEFASEDDGVAKRLMGLRDIWGTASKGFMAAAIGERQPLGKRSLWLFRNSFRPLWLFDLRDTLGQVFFVSTPYILQVAVQDSPILQSFFRKKKLKFIDLPTEEIWLLEIDLENPTVTDEQLHKFQVEATGDFEPWDYKGELLKADPISMPNNVHTCLNKNEELVREEYKNPNHFHHFSATQNILIGDVVDACKEIQRTTLDIESCLSHTDYPHKDLEELLDFLGQVKLDLRGTLRMLED